MRGLSLPEMSSGPLCVLVGVKRLVSGPGKVGFGVTNVEVLYVLDAIAGVLGTPGSGSIVVISKGAESGRAHHRPAD